MLGRVKHSSSMVVLRLLYRVPVFLISCLLAIGLAFFAKMLGASIKIRHGIYSIWRKTFLLLLGIKINIKSGFKPSFAAVLMGNHRSYADVLFILSGTPTVFLSKAEIKKWPIIYQAAQALDTVFVQRNDKESRSDARKELAKSISKGLSPVVFPEGTTSYSGLLPFNPGMFYTAAEMQVPIVPFFIEYSDPEMAWVGKEKFIPHLLRMFMRPKWHVDITIGHAFYGHDGEKLSNDIYDWMKKKLTNG